MLVERYPLSDGYNVGLWIDVTALKLAENALRETAQRLSHRNAELSQAQIDLEEINASLEERVCLRTEELLAAQSELMNKERMAAEQPGAREARIVLRTTAHSNALELQIEDNGPGIPPENLAKVFEPLFTTKRRGTGLGLPTVKQIVEQHGGTIVLESTLGEFTRAVIRLPLA